MEKQFNGSPKLTPEQEIADLQKFIKDREDANRKEEKLYGVIKSTADPELTDARRKLGDLLKQRGGKNN